MRNFNLIYSSLYSRNGQNITYGIVTASSAQGPIYGRTTKWMVTTYKLLGPWPEARGQKSKSKILNILLKALWSAYVPTFDVKDRPLCTILTLQIYSIELLYFLQKRSKGQKVQSKIFKRKMFVMLIYLVPHNNKLYQVW